MNKAYSPARYSKYLNKLQTNLEPYRGTDQEVDRKLKIIQDEIAKVSQSVFYDDSKGLPPNLSFTPPDEIAKDIEEIEKEEE